MGCLRRGVPAWCRRALFLALLCTSLLSILPPPLAAQAVRGVGQAQRGLILFADASGVREVEYAIPAR